MTETLYFWYYIWLKSSVIRIKLHSWYSDNNIINGRHITKANAPSHPLILSKFLIWCLSKQLTPALLIVESLHDNIAMQCGSMFSFLFPFILYKIEIFLQDISLFLWSGSKTFLYLPRYKYSRSILAVRARVYFLKKPSFPATGLAYIMFHSITITVYFHITIDLFI